MSDVDAHDDRLVILRHAVPIRISHHPLKYTVLVLTTMDALIGGLVTPAASSHQPPALISWPNQYPLSRR